MSNVLLTASPAVTVALVLARPRLVGRRIGPAEAALVGALLMALSGYVAPADVPSVGVALWRPFVGLAAIMLLAGIAERAGVIDRLAVAVERGTHGPVVVAFTATFVIAAFAATVFNNDAAILVLTPLIATLVKRRYPRRPHLAVPFAFAVFCAAGVAPLPISNPINYVVTTHAGIGFNAYAVRMIPVALAGLATSFGVLLWIFRRDLRDRVPGRGEPAAPLGAMAAGEASILALLVLVLAAYPVVSWFGGPVWAVAAVGALLGAGVCALYRIASPRELAGQVSWGILIFLGGIFLIARGLENAGAVDAVARIYGSVAGPAQVFLVTAVSAVASATVNNHAVAVLNAVALEGADSALLLAALIGGDLGPRMLPIGSLAALLWLDILRRGGVEIPIGQFIRVGVLVTVPALVVSVLVLLLVT